MCSQLTFIYRIIAMHACRLQIEHIKILSECASTLQMVVYFICEFQLQLQIEIMIIIIVAIFEMASLTIE